MEKQRNIFGFIGHALRQPFIFATGLAALMHSTWSLGTLFAGASPQPAISWEYAGWIIPAVLIAFALDVGQIVTSAELRDGERTLAKYATFAIFAVATYYLQWLYIVHHMPALELGLGVSMEARASVMLMRDAAIWVIPALLPLSTLLYTFSYASTHDTHVKEAQAAPRKSVEVKPAPVRTAPANNAGTSANEVRDALDHASDNGPVHVDCPHCDWQSEYETKRSAQMALTAHLRKHPETRARVVVNGRVHAEAVNA